MAIDYKDLRCGNIVHYEGEGAEYEDEEDVVVGRIYETELMGYAYTCYHVIDCQRCYHINNPSFFSPISLTEEWLKIFGFQMRMINGIINEWYIMCTPPNYKREFALRFRFGVLRDTPNGVCDEQSWAPWGDSGDAHNFNIRFIHQLQNSYHHITGEELKIKEV
jgi:hypothetical protein